MNAQARNAIKAAEKAEKKLRQKEEDFDKCIFWGICPTCGMSLTYVRKPVRVLGFKMHKEFLVCAANHLLIAPDGTDCSPIKYHARANHPIKEVRDYWELATDDGTI